MSKRRFTEKFDNDPSAVFALKPNHPAMVENRTLFPTTVVDVTKTTPDRLLISGENNRKLGEFVEKGKFKGYAFYGLSLEERATCPKHCEQRGACYGNGMQMARRHRILNEDVFFQRLETEIATLAQKHTGILIRLHVLGDFPSVEYVGFWSDILADFPNVACYGYSHRLHLKADGDEIGQALANVKEHFPDRFRIRWSRPETGVDTATVIDYTPPTGKVGEAIVCPAQTDATACCATCAMCWEANKPVLFIKHGRPVGSKFAAQAAVVNKAGDLDSEEVEVLRDRVAQLEHKVNDREWIPSDWGITGREATILNVLVQRAFLSKEAMHEVVYGGKPDEQVADLKIMAVFICKLRAKLKAVDPSFIIETVWGTGWRLSQETAHKLKCIQRGEPYRPITILGTALIEGPAVRPIIPITLPKGVTPAKLALDRPDVRMIRVADLQIETAYQRSLGPKSIRLIQRIISGWDWAKFKPPIVSEAEDGRFNVVDGQHTAIAAASHPQIAFLPCVVVDAPTVQARAASFVAHNTDRVAMTTHQIFIGRAAAGDEVAADLLRIIEANGAMVPKWIPKKGEASVGEIIGIGNLEEIYRSSGPLNAARAVQAVVRAHVKPASSMVFRMLNMLFAYEVDHKMIVPLDVLIKALGTLDNIEREAMELGTAAKIPKYQAGLRLLIRAIDQIIEPTRATA
jgi:hypothetical protein